MAMTSDAANQASIAATMDIDMDIDLGLEPEPELEPIQTVSVPEYLCVDQC